MIKEEFWEGKRVLITGHTGFKGSWLSLWLLDMGANVAGYALDPYTDRDNFVVTNLKDRMIDVRGDLNNKETLKMIFDDFKPEIVFHLAAQPLVRLSYEKPVETYQTNVIGTLNVLECIKETASVKEAIMVTTDKCYYNNEQMWGYRENDAFGGYDMYSSSKACAEILIESYRNSFFNIKDYDKHGKAIASVRAGNVIGGGDWSKDRLIPDCIKAFEKNEVVEIRSPKAIRPWQHVLDCLSGYILLAQKLWEQPAVFSEGWNFGPDMASFEDVWTLVSKMIDKLGKGKIKDCSEIEHVHEANLLFLDITKARLKLGWEPKWNIDKAIDKTIEWYEKAHMKEDMFKCALNQIHEYRRI